MGLNSSTNFFYHKRNKKNFKAKGIKEFEIIPRILDYKINTPDRFKKLSGVKKDKHAHQQTKGINP